MSKDADYVYTEFYAPHLAGGKPVTQQGPRKTLKTAIHAMYWRVLTELSLNRFKWYGLPESIDERYLELSLMQHGRALFFWWEPPIELVNGQPVQAMDGRYMVQQFHGFGLTNHYDNPTNFRVNSHTGVGGTFTSKQAVPVWNNYLRTPDQDIIQVYANRLTELDTTIDVNTVNLRHPKILAYSDDLRLTMDNVNRQFQEGVPTIKLNQGIDLNQIAQTLDWGGDAETMPALLAGKGKMWNDALMMLGVPTVNQDKKERMITDEAETGKDQSEVIRNISLNSRKQAAQQINDMFGLDVAVEWRAHDEMQQLVSQMSAMAGVDDETGEPGDDPGESDGLTVTPNTTNDDENEDEDEGNSP